MISPRAFSPIAFRLAALSLTLGGCEVEPSDELSFTEAVKKVYAPCNRDEIKLNSAAKGL